MTPTVSVIVPAYNATGSIGETLRSVLAQTYSVFEVVVVDDGSTDDPAALCDALNDSRIRVVRQSNRGLAGARNTGIRHARGRFLAFLDADDLWLPEKLAQHVEHLEAKPDVGVSFAPSYFIDAEGQPLGYRQKPRLRGLDMFHILCRNPVGNGSAAVVRREVMDDIAFHHDFGNERGVDCCWFDEQFRQSEDVECWVRIAATTDWNFEGLEQPLTLYRVHGGGLSADIEEQYRTWGMFLDKVSDYAPEVVARWGCTARAFQLLYLGRRAVRHRDGRQAMRLVARALRTDWRSLLYEPARVASTAAAAGLLTVLPRPLYERVERAAMVCA